jgi:hypothetical protein
MRTFNEYIIVKEFDRIIHEINMVAENNPDFNSLLLQEGWFGNAAKAIGQFARGAWSGGGIKAGSQAAWSTMTGPATQYQNALNALNKALGQIQKDPNWSKSTTTGSATLPAMNLSQWLQETIKELQNQITQFNNKDLANKNINAQGTTATAQQQIGADGKPFIPQTADPTTKGNIG